MTVGHLWMKGIRLEGIRKKLKVFLISTLALHPEIDCNVCSSCLRLDIQHVNCKSPLSPVRYIMSAFPSCCSYGEQLINVSAPLQLVWRTLECFKNPSTNTCRPAASRELHACEQGPDKGGRKKKRAGADKKQMRLDFILGSGVMCVLSKETDKSLNLVE